MRLNYYIAMISVVAFEESLAALQLSAPQQSSALSQDTSMAQIWNPVTSAVKYLAAPKRTTALAGTKAKMGDGDDPEKAPLSKEEHAEQEKIAA